jgi:multidrug efflux pump subunit AcrA (membrane-fusion protein)
MISSTLRYLTFAIAIFGFFAMFRVFLLLRASDTPIQPPPAPTPVKPQGYPIAATGIIEAFDGSVSVSAPDTGIIASVHIKVGDTVAKNQLLFTLDDSLLQSSLRLKKAEFSYQQSLVEVSQKELQKTSDAFNRLNSLQGSGAVSKDDLTNKRNDLAISSAQLLTVQNKTLMTQNEIADIQTRINRLHIKAPKAGTILRCELRQGEFFTPGSQAAPLVLGDIQILQIRVDVDEQNASRVIAGKPAKAYIKGNNQRFYPIEFIKIEPYVIPKQSLTGASTERVDTRVLQLLYQLKPEPQNSLYVGLQVDVFIDP